jgi:hypothetical protein
MYNQQQPQQQQIQVKINDDALKGIYSNSMFVNHTKEEFIMDFASIFGQQGLVGARIITSPGHFKRIINAMKENLDKYENAFGKIIESAAPSTEIGFSDKK